MASTRHVGPEQTARRTQMCVSSAVARFILGNPSCSPGSDPGAGGEPLALIKGAFPQASRYRQERQAGPAVPDGRALERERRAGERAGQDILGCAAQVRPRPGPELVGSRRHCGGLAPTRTPVHPASSCLRVSASAAPVSVMTSTAARPRTVPQPRLSRQACLPRVSFSWPCRLSSPQPLLPSPPSVRALVLPQRY